MILNTVPRAFAAHQSALHSVLGSVEFGLNVSALADSDNHDFVCCGNDHLSPLKQYTIEYASPQKAQNIHTAAKANGLTKAKIRAKTAIRNEINSVTSASPRT